MCGNSHKNTQQNSTEHDNTEHDNTKQTIAIHKAINIKNNTKKERLNEVNTMSKTSIELKSLNTKTMKVTIVGDTDLVLNKMNDVSTRSLVSQRKDKAKDTAKPNVWEEIITSMHWYNGKPTDFTEDGLKQALIENAPCLTSFGLKKSFGDAVVRNEIDKYKTKFDAGVNILGKGNLVPIKFATHNIDEKLMSPKKGAPVLVHLNRFEGWSATIEISYMENVYSVEQILNIVNLAGFGLGIGSGRSSGYGRYHVTEVIG